MASGDTKTEALMDILENGGNIDGIAGCCNTNLQNYIIDSINSVSEAKASVTAKGGTVGNTGLAGLASEIAGIPSGGGGATSGWYAWVYSGAVGGNIPIQSLDYSKFEEAGYTTEFGIVSMYTISMIFFGADEWMDESGVGGPYTQAEMSSVLGITFPQGYVPEENDIFYAIYVDASYFTPDASN